MSRTRTPAAAERVPITYERARVTSIKLVDHPDRGTVAQVQVAYEQVTATRRLRSGAERPEHAAVSEQAVTIMGDDLARIEAETATVDALYDALAKHALDALGVPQE